jgi:thiol-disulfide isomerase/thioredoxin
MKTSPLHSVLLSLASAVLLHFNGAAHAEDASLEIKSITPAPPAELKAGERLTVTVQYKNPESRPVHIWARPYTNGKSTGGYRAHPSPSYNAPTGRMEGWFYFDQPTVVDEVRVEMIANAGSADRKTLATTSQQLKATWTGTKAPTAGKPQPATASTPRGKAPAAGQAVDIKFTALDGREVDLAKLRGKVVLVDFWATWCGPCVGEIPHVLEAYRKFHDRGFEIIGISFDQDKITLERMLQQKGMTWPQYFDGQGWQNQFGTEYGINGIPAMWLIDKNGLIATTSARTDLAGQVEALLNK